MEIEESVGLVTPTINICCDKLEEILAFSWMLPRATENSAAGHMWPPGR